MSLLSYSKVNKWTSARPDNWLSLLFNDPYTSVCILVHIYIGNTHTHTQRPRPRPRKPQVGAVQLDALTNLFGANCQWETSARTAVDKTGCWGDQIPLLRVGDNGGRMCWCAAGGWGGTMDGLVSPLADWFEMAPLSLSLWGVPLSGFWFPLLTNSKQKSISFSRGENIDPCFSWRKWLKNVFARDDWLSNSPSTLYVFFSSSLPSSSSFAVFIAQWRWWIVGCWMILGF